MPLLMFECLNIFGPKLIIFAPLQAYLNVFAGHPCSCSAGLYASLSKSTRVTLLLPPAKLLHHSMEMGESST